MRQLLTSIQVSDDRQRKCLFASMRMAALVVLHKRLLDATCKGIRSLLRVVIRHNNTTRNPLTYYLKLTS